MDVMINTGDFNALGVTILEMPYKGEESSMFILLPKENISGNDCLSLAPIDCVVLRLNADNLRHAFSDLQEHNLYIQIPKFTLEQKFTDDFVQVRIDTFTHAS